MLHLVWSWSLAPWSRDASEGGHISPLRPFILPACSSCLVSSHFSKPLTALFFRLKHHGFDQLVSQCNWQDCLDKHSGWGETTCPDGTIAAGYVMDGWDRCFQVIIFDLSRNSQPTGWTHISFSFICTPATLTAIWAWEEFLDPPYLSRRAGQVGIHNHHSSIQGEIWVVSCPFLLGLNGRYGNVWQSLPRTGQPGRRHLLVPKISGWTYTTWWEGLD